MTDPVQAAYDTWAASYDDSENPTRDADAAALRALLPDLTGARVLELGSGTGKNTEALAAAAEVVCVDASPAMQARARERLGHHPQLRFVTADLRDPLPVPDAHFDLATFDLVLEHLEDLGPPIAEAARALRPSGQLIVIELHPSRQLAGKVARFQLASGDEVRVPAHLHLTTEYLAAAEAAGLRLIELGEWASDGRRATSQDGAAPRLVSFVFEKPTSG